MVSRIQTWGVARPVRARRRRRLQRRTTGFMAQYSKGPSAWRSRMQKTISLSTAEAEHYAISEMAIEVLYLRNLLGTWDFGNTSRHQYTKTIWRASNGVIISWVDVSVPLQAFRPRGGPETAYGARQGLDQASARRRLHPTALLTGPAS